MSNAPDCALARTSMSPSRARSSMARSSASTSSAPWSSTSAADSAADGLRALHQELRLRQQFAAHDAALAGRKPAPPPPAPSASPRSRD